MRLFDGHCDTIYESYAQQKDLLRENPRGHLDLKRMRLFSPCAQFFALFWNSAREPKVPLSKRFRDEYDIFIRQIGENRDQIAFCRTGAQAAEAFQAGKAAAFLSVEGAELLDCSLTRLDEAFDLGVRAVNLTWNHANALSGSSAEEPGRGLSQLGKQFVLRMQEKGMLVDVSHLSDPGFWDVMELAQKPVFASHSDSRFLWNHRRNLTDGQFAAIIENQGVAGLNFYTEFLGRDPDLDTVLAHLDHFLALGGEDHISIGGDWDGCETLPRGMEDGLAGLARLYEFLLRKNYPERLINQLYFSNLMRVVSEVCTTSAHEIKA